MSQELEQLLQASDSALASDPEVARRLAETALATASEYADRAKARAQHGICLLWLARYRDALLELDEAAELARHLGDERLLGRIINAIGVVHLRLGNAAQAIEHFEKALALRVRSGDRAGEAATLHNLGIQRRELGDFDGALEAYRAALLIDRERGDREGEGRTLTSIGVVLHQLGRSSEAEAVHREAIAIAREIGDRVSEVRGLENLATILVDTGAPERALAETEALMANLPLLPSHEVQADLLATRGRALRLIGRLEEARASLLDAAQVPAAQDRKRFVVELYRELSLVYELLGDSAQALHALKQSLSAQQALQQEEAQLRRRAIEFHRELAQARAEIERARREAEQDPLTGLANRRALDRLLVRELRDDASSRLPLVIALIDIDFFKQLNDRFGHQAGDQVLVEFGARLRHACRSDDFIARYGGEEFCLLFRNLSAELARDRLAQLHRALSGEPYCVAGQKRPVTVSIGAYCVCEGANLSPEQALAKADAALYEAKAGGRNCIVVR
ncbi:MAG: diguanylate cyclase [Casimicrobiaceae bacterium]|nr:diguanylate cyclase [Casimicrobiaceae bacterium]MCX8099565.1 diguanylate cyclase [Casimicrobiaceae bacterium]MDW8313009.1 tetratricopeptide repeat-containing diguanylate cyclase [Burkholderiales bacterium]